MPDEIKPDEKMEQASGILPAETPVDPEIEKLMGSREAKTMVEQDLESASIPQESSAESDKWKRPEKVKSRFHLSKRIALLSAIAMVVLVAGGTAGYWFMNKDTEGSENQATVANEEVVQRFGVSPGLLEGAVEFSSDSGATWQKLSSDTELKEADQVRTLSDGRAVLLIDDGSAARLASNSTVLLSSLATDNIVLKNLAGELYTRVTKSENRKFAVVVDDATYQAKGTAYRTSNLPAKKGVEVFHSTVAKDQTDITEGNAFFTLVDQKEKENTVSAIDLAALKQDGFIKWNSEQDKKEAEFANALGVLVELDKPDPTPPPVATPPKSTQSSGITLSGSVSEYSAVFSWKVSGVDTSNGFKLVKSKTSQSPTYPENSAAYIESGKTSYSLYLGDGKTYYFRICAYRDGSCDSYSNTVTVTTPVKPKDPIVLGDVTLSLSGTSASWSDSGTAPYGFKLVIDKSPSPTYPGAEFKVYSGGTSTNLPDGLTSGTKYYMRVCKYDDGSCVNYSNQLEYTAP